MLRKKAQMCKDGVQLNSYLFVNIDLEMKVINYIKYFTIKHNLLTEKILKRYFKKSCDSVEMFIFTATTGRSATATLAHIFDKVDNCSSHHEPHPAMNGRAMINKNNGDDELSKFIYKYIKSINLRRLSSGYRYYVETNHMFIKSFADYVIDEFRGKVKVIHLIRDPVKVADSITRLNQCPGTEIGNQWWLDYHASNNLIQIAEVLDCDESFKDDFYKSLWYWYETEARVANFKKKYPDVFFIDFFVDDLNDGSKLCSLMNTLDIEYDKNRIIDAAATRVNRRDQSKKKQTLGRDLAQKMNKKFCDMLLSRNYIMSNIVDSKREA